MREENTYMIYIYGLFSSAINIRTVAGFEGMHRDLSTWHTNNHLTALKTVNHALLRVVYGLNSALSK